jgi:hypothetical protein
VTVNQRSMACEPADVFDVLADGWLYPVWVVGASRMRAVDASWPATGTAIHHSVGTWPLLLNDATTMLEWEPARHALLKARAWPVGEAHVAVDVRRHDNGCLVRMTEDVIAGPARLVPRFLRDGVVHARNTETLRRLAYLSEGRAGR